MAIANLVTRSGSCLRFSVSLLSVPLEEVWKGCQVANGNTQSAPIHSLIILYLFEKCYVGRESRLSFPSKVFCAFHLSVRKSSTPSQAHLCGCRCVSTSRYPYTCDAKKRPCKIAMWVSDSSAFMNHPCCCSLSACHGRKTEIHWGMSHLFESLQQERLFKNTPVSLVLITSLGCKRGSLWLPVHLIHKFGMGMVVQVRNLPWRQKKTVQKRKILSRLITRVWRCLPNWYDYIYEW